jgi:RES domain-containing protein
VGRPPGWCGLEFGGRRLGRCADAWDLYDALGGPLANQELADLFISSIELEWSELDPYGLRPEERLRYGWDRFVEAVKAGPLVHQEPTSPEDRDSIDPTDTLDEMGRLLGRTNFNILKMLPAGTTIRRGRAHGTNESPRDAVSLGSPPPDKAAPLRMSAAGKSVFYGAENDDTIRAELAEAADPALTIAEWQLVSPVCFLDLAGLVPVPSIFDAVARPVRSAMTFLHGFADAIAKSPGDVSDYIPTQLFAEFLSGTVLDHEGRPVGAIRYRSAMLRGEACWVFFVDASGCADPGQVSPDTWLVLDRDSVRLQPRR